MMPCSFRRIFFRQFSLVYRISFWFSRHLSPLGHFLLGLLMVSAAFGANTQAAAAYQLSALLAALFCLALLWSFFSRRATPPVSVERLTPTYGTMGEPMRYQIAIINTGTSTERGLSLLDCLDVRFPDWNEFSSSVDSDKEHRNPFDRYVGFHRWQELMRMNRGASMAEKTLPDLPPGQRITVEMELTPLRRGRLRFDCVCIYRPEPFGLLRTRHTFPLPKVRCVLPRCHPVSLLPPAGSRSYQNGGVALANAVGESEEFLSLREFRHGDVPRNIHWRSSAKLGRLVVKEFQDEYFVRRTLVLDTFCVSSRTEEFETAVSVAASLVIREPQRDSLLDLLFIEQQAHCFTAGRGLSETVGMLEVLAGVQPIARGTIELLTQHVLQGASALSSVVCVLLAWDQPRKNFVESLHAVGLPVSVFVVQERPPNPKLEATETDSDLKTGSVLFCLRHIRPSHLAEDLQWN